MKKNTYNKLTFTEALEECKNKGCSLPTCEELRNNKLFRNIKTDDYYWTGDLWGWGLGSVWVINSENKRIRNYGKDNKHYLYLIKEEK